MANTWNPKGGEFEIKPLLVDIEDITGPQPPPGEEPFVRPDSGNFAAKKALASISLDFILGKPLNDNKMAELKQVLPNVPAIDMLDPGVAVELPKRP